MLMLAFGILNPDGICRLGQPEQFSRRFIARFPKQKISRASRNPEAVTLDHPAPPPLHCFAYRLRPLLRFWDVDTDA